MEAKEKIRKEVAEYKEKLTVAKETIAQFKEEIAKISKSSSALAGS